MELNLLPVRDQAPRRPVLGVALEPRHPAEIAGRIAWAAGSGFAGVTLAATGEPGGLYAPEVSADARALLRQGLSGFRAVAVEAPHQATFDLTLVSPSAAIRRASVSELWSVCKFAEAVGAGVVLVRTGLPPVGTADRSRDVHLSECLSTLDRTAGERGVYVALWNRDRFHRLADLDLLEDLRLSFTGLAVDVAHALSMGESPEFVAAFIAERADRVLQVRVPWQRDVGERLAPALRDCGYGGMVCFASGARDMADREEMATARQWWAEALGLAAEDGEESGVDDNGADGANGGGTAGG